jgi:hypothetical protein
MINDKVQKQEAGDSSTNLQGQSIVINQGISYSDAKDIALDVYKANYIQLSQDAAELARSRAEELTDDFLAKLKEEKEEAISEISTPSMQSAIYDAQKQYARTGDKDLEELLVDILVERAITPDRSIKQIVLDEALVVAGKLTSEHMDALTINFLMSKVKKSNLLNLDSILLHIKEEIIPFTNELSDASSCYEHLAYAGCGSIMETSTIKPIEDLYLVRYPALFSKGFTEEQFRNDVGDPALFHKLLIRCFHFVNNIQLSCMNVEVIRHVAQEHKISDENLSKLISLFNSTLMNQAEVKQYFLEITPEIHRLFDLWNNSSLSKFSLTTVGIAIAQANYKRKTGLKFDLGIWVK